MSYTCGYSSNNTRPKVIYACKVFRGVEGGFDLHSGNIPFAFCSGKILVHFVIAVVSLPTFMGGPPWRRIVPAGCDGLQYGRIHLTLH